MPERSEEAMLVNEPLEIYIGGFRHSVELPKALKAIPVSKRIASDFKDILAISDEEDTGAAFVFIYESGGEKVLEMLAMMIDACNVTPKIDTSNIGEVATLKEVWRATQALMVAFNPLA